MVRLLIFNIFYQCVFFFYLVCNEDAFRPAFLMQKFYLKHRSFGFAIRMERADRISNPVGQK